MPKKRSLNLPFVDKGGRIEMPTPGWGSSHPLGTPPRAVAGYGGGELSIQSPVVRTGNFFENPSGFLGIVYWYDVWQ